MSIRKLIARAKVISDLTDDILWVSVTVGLSIMYALMIVGCIQHRDTWLAIFMLIIGMATIRTLRVVKLAMNQFHWKGDNR